MKVYGFDYTGPGRGELLAANVPADAFDFGPDILAAELGWVRVFSTFTDAQRALLIAMQYEPTDPDLVRGVRTLKASQVTCWRHD